MQLKVLASGSSGNCYLLENKEEILILEAGISYKRIQEGLDFNINKVAGCLISHEHKDHSLATEQLARAGVTIYTSQGTANEIGANLGHRLEVIKAHELIKVGGFTIYPFDTQHDAAEPLGFLIQHQDMGKLLFITDSYYCKYKFQGVDHIMVECNYKKELLQENIDKGKIPGWLQDRIVKSHFELGNVKEFLRSSDLTKTKNIVLVHLSSQNSNKDLFRREIERETGRPTLIAEKGLELDISKVF